MQKFSKSDKCVLIHLSDYCMTLLHHRARSAFRTVASARLQFRARTPWRRRSPLWSNACPPRPVHSWHIGLSLRLPCQRAAACCRALSILTRGWLCFRQATVSFFQVGLLVARLHRSCGGSQAWSPSQRVEPLPTSLAHAHQSSTTSFILQSSFETRLRAEMAAWGTTAGPR